MKQKQDKYDTMNPNELAVSVLSQVPYDGMRGRLDTTVPSDLNMTSAECVVELRQKAGAI